MLESARFISLTVVDFRKRRHVGAARRHWVRMRAELLAAGEEVISYAVADRRGRRITLVTLAGDEDTLRRAAASATHVHMVRWTIERRVSLWSAVYELSGWSSMSGASAGAWSLRRPRRPREPRQPGQPGQPGQPREIIVSAPPA